MPKIIKHVREQLLAEAKKQIAARGYAGTTMRSVADACGVGVGTVYNYFPSKEMLVASFMAEEWEIQIRNIAALPSDAPEALLRGIYESLCFFAKNNQKLFSDEDAAKVSSIGFAARHQKLRQLLAGFILPICKDSIFQNAEFASEFIAESLISWAMAEKDFDTVYGVIQKLFIKS